MIASARHLAQRLATCPSHPTQPLPSSGVCFACTLVIVPSKPVEMPRARIAPDGLPVTGTDSLRERIRRAAEKAAQHKRDDVRKAERAARRAAPPKPTGIPPKLLTLNGETMSVTQWSQKLGKAESTIYVGLQTGVPLDQLLVPTKVVEVQCYDVGNGELLSVRDMAARIGSTRKAIYLRIKKGLTGPALIAPAARKGCRIPAMVQVERLATKLGLVTIEHDAGRIEVRSAG